MTAVLRNGRIYSMLRGLYAVCFFCLEGREV
jgi:hypothetical protein